MIQTKVTGILVIDNPSKKNSEKMQPTDLHVARYSTCVGRQMENGLHQEVF